MSTISKLDKNVRLDRMLRKMALRELESDATNAARGIATGKALLASAPNEEYANKVRDQLLQMLHFKIISDLNLIHLTAVKKDPSRTGAAKDRIFQRLGMEAR